MTGHTHEQAALLSRLADGDLAIDVKPRSEKDTIGSAMGTMVVRLNEIFSGIHNGVTQVSGGSRQIADGSQTLAQGSMEQANAVDQLSSSVHRIEEKTKANAEMAGRAAKLAETINDNAEKGSRQMNDMITAVEEIKQASLSINKVIKVIDDIAFQTNILALNAAVEAARAGQHGKGFAVVAEEVRNLAAKSAEAAKDTDALITNSMEKADLGTRIADETSASLKEIVSGIGESSKLVVEIARSSDEQAAGIAKINTGISQVAQVIQQNSATAQESAAASEEMSGQANMLENMISQFKLKQRR
jgi:methyl-accepting chemotaxis protein